MHMVGSPVPKGSYIGTQTSSYRADALQPSLFLLLLLLFCYILFCDEKTKIALRILCVVAP